MLADGCFDPIHVGHVRYLKEAATLCRSDDTLTVRIAPDSDIQAKGRAPFQTRKERGETVQGVVRGMAVCDLDFSERLEDVVRRLRPHVLVKGIDWHGRLPEGVLEACAFCGTHIAYVNTREKSTTERLA